MDEKEMYVAISGRVGLPLNFVVKEFHVFRILGQIGGRISKGNYPCVFKGGTALNKIYLGQKQRFSEDLDFNDYEDAGDAERIGRLEGLVEGIEGYEAGRTFRLGNTIRTEMYYSTPWGQKDNVRLEFNLKDPKKEYRTTIETASSVVCGAMVGGLVTYPLEDLVAQKMNAMLERVEGKDVYDVYHAMALVKGMRRSIEWIAKTEREMGGEEFIQKVVERLNAFHPKKMEKLTNPYILVENRPKNWEENTRTLVELIKNKCRKEEGV
ncbi:MAG: nucleotidyl transferase AbiEii/AbiGii toxin family protein [Candidatus Micrarchaeota archaeon]